MKLVGPDEIMRLNDLNTNIHIVIFEYEIRS